MSRRPRILRPLGPEEKPHIAAFIRPLVAVAKDSKHCFHRMALAQISLTMWRWTADGVCPSTGIVWHDGLKYRTDLVPSTEAAIRLKKGTGSNKGLRHEHVVPRIRLAERICDKDMSAAEIIQFLDRFCAAVIVTTEEDKKLSRSKMPGEWKWEDGCRYERYRVAGLHPKIRFPDEGC